MKKILYIMASSKNESISDSKTSGYHFVDLLMSNEKYELIELDLYKEKLPVLTNKFFSKRATIVEGDNYDQLNIFEKNTVDKLIKLQDQFLDCDIYVIATPMWSISFPYILKQYIDCITVNKKLIDISNNKIKGLLDDKERTMIYIQSSGGKYPDLLNFKLNHGLTYIKNLFKFLGIKNFYSVMVEGIEDNKIGKRNAFKKAYKEMGKIIDLINKK